VRDVEDGFIEQRLRRQSRRGEEKLLVRMEPAVYSGKDRRPAVVDGEVRMSANCVRREDVGRLVGAGGS